MTSQRSFDEHDIVSALAKALTSAQPGHRARPPVRPDPRDLYSGLQVSVEEWFHDFEAYKVDQHGRAINQAQWYPILIAYCANHVGLTNTLNAIPNGMRGTLANIRQAFLNIKFPGGQPQVARNAQADYHEFRNLPPSSDPLAVLEEIRKQVARIDPADRPTHADQVDHLLRSVDPTYMSHLIAMNPPNLEAAEDNLRHILSIRIPALGRPLQQPAPGIPVFTAMGGEGDQYGNVRQRNNPPAAASVVITIYHTNIVFTMGSSSSSADVPPAALTTADLQSAIHQLKIDSRAEIQQTLRSFGGEQGKLIENALSEHTKQLQAVVASVQTTDANSKRRMESPPRDYYSQEDRRDDKKSRYSSTYGARRGRLCKFCDEKGWEKATTHTTDDCFHHPNRAKAVRNQKAQLGFTFSQQAVRKHQQQDQQHHEPGTKTKPIDVDGNALLAMAQTAMDKAAFAMLKAREEK